MPIGVPKALYGCGFWLKLAAPTETTLRASTGKPMLPAAIGKSAKTARPFKRLASSSTSTNTRSRRSQFFSSAGSVGAPSGRMPVGVKPSKRRYVGVLRSGCGLKIQTLLDLFLDADRIAPGFCERHFQHILIHRAVRHMLDPLRVLPGRAAMRSKRSAGSFFASRIALPQQLQAQARERLTIKVILAAA